MRRSIGAILAILLVIEIGAAIAIVAIQPNGFGSLANFNVAGGPERRQEQPSQTFDLGGQAANLIVTNSNGRVTINGDAKATNLIINAVKIVRGNNDEIFNRFNYTVTKDANTINVKVERIVPSVGLNLDRVEITVTAPRNLATNVTVGSGNVFVDGLDSRDQNLSFSAGSGNITLNNTQGREIRTNTDSGNVRLNNVTGEANSQTGSGNVTISGLTGTLAHLKTGSGDLRIDALAAGLDAETNSGNIQVQSTTNVSSLRLKTGSGDIRFSGQAALNGDAQASTGSGTLELNFTNLSNPPRFEVSTGSGSINFNIKNLSGQFSNNKHNLTAGNSGPLFRINTGSGDVRISG